MILLDATVFIDFLNNIPQAVDFMDLIEHKNTALSSVTLAEVLVGCNQEEHNQILIFSQQLHFFNIDREIAISAARLRQEYRWKLPDAFQAALALEHKLTLITRNTKDFDPQIHTFVKIPYHLSVRKTR